MNLINKEIWNNIIIEIEILKRLNQFYKEWILYHEICINNNGYAEGL